MNPPGRPRFPFPAILGMDLAKTSMLLHAVDKRIGGILLSGDRGCAKTTLARAFGNILERIDSDSPLIEVPLGATEERLVGSVQVDQLLEEGGYGEAFDGNGMNAEQIMERVFALESKVGDN